MEELEHFSWKMSCRSLVQLSRAAELGIRGPSPRLRSNHTRLTIPYRVCDKIHRPTTFSCRRITRGMNPLIKISQMKSSG